MTEKLNSNCDCNEDKNYTCYDCKYWHLIDPNYSGLTDIAICASRLLEVDEDTDICVDFKEMSVRDKAVQNLVRRKMLDVNREFQEDIKKYYKNRMKEEVVDDILEIIKWSIMRDIDK